MAYVRKRLLGQVETDTADVDGFVDPWDFPDPPAGGGGGSVTPAVQPVDWSDGNGRSGIMPHDPFVDVPILLPPIVPGNGGHHAPNLPALLLPGDDTGDDDTGDDDTGDDDTGDDDTGDDPTGGLEDPEAIEVEVGEVDPRTGEPRPPDDGTRASPIARAGLGGKVLGLPAWAVIGAVALGLYLTSDTTPGRRR